MQSVSGCDDGRQSGSGASEERDKEATARLAALEEELTKIKEVLNEQQAFPSTIDVARELREEKRLRLEAESARTAAEEMLDGLRSSLAKATAARQMLFESLKSQTRERCRLEAEVKELRRALDARQEAVELQAETERGENMANALEMPRTSALKRPREERGKWPERPLQALRHVDDGEQPWHLPDRISADETSRRLPHKRNKTSQDGRPDAYGEGAPLQHGMEIVPGAPESAAVDHQPLVYSAHGNADAAAYGGMPRRKKKVRIIEPQNMSDIINKHRALEEAEASIEELRGRLWSKQGQHTRPLEAGAAMDGLPSSQPVTFRPRIDRLGDASIGPRGKEYQPYSWKHQGGFEKESQMAYAHRSTASQQGQLPGSLAMEHLHNRRDSG